MNKLTKRVTTLDIAKRAGVSKTTVSYVINGTGSVSHALSQKILAIAEELGYRRNRLAIATRTGQTKTIGLILPDLTNPFFPTLAQSVQSTACQHGYSVFIVDCQNSLKDERQGLEQLCEHAVDGLVWCPTEDKVATEQALPFPTIVVDRAIEGFDSVYADAYQGGVIQGQYLLAGKHTRVGILSGPERSPSAIARRKGLYDTIESHCDILWDLPLEYNLTINETLYPQILDHLPTCVVAANDTLAVRLLWLYHHSGIDVPGDVSIIGFDDIDWASLVTPPLTTIKLPIKELGQHAFELLLRRMENPQLPLANRVLDVSLVERGSFKRSSIE